MRELHLGFQTGWGKTQKGNHGRLWEVDHDPAVTSGE